MCVCVCVERVSVRKDDVSLAKLRLTTFYSIDAFVQEYMAKQHGYDHTTESPSPEVIRMEFVKAHEYEWQAHPEWHADFNRVMIKILKNRSVLAKHWLHMRSGGECVRVSVDRLRGTPQDTH